ncbi:uncharacterized protein IL334_000103 [Kwoniella shivajii]|uniref:Uncharacterized protein n=1 Tax=Kwoniella shivajii TaxID=564305 RepID=A0ABZ1CPR4_9TREE|nr:hypothetical protein IL334_000103 [Kwoniella shivajii]
MWTIKIPALLGLVSIAFAVPLQTTFNGIEIVHRQTAREIDTWALNPAGEAAVIKVKKYTNERPEYELHLLAINAQYTVPSVLYGQAVGESLYTFLDDKTFLTLIESRHKGIWKLSSQTLNCTTIPPAFPPSASPAQMVTKLAVSSNVEQLIFSSGARILSLILKSGEVILLDLAEEKGNWKIKGKPRTPSFDNLVINDATSNATHLALTARSASSKLPSALYSLSLLDPDATPQRLTTSSRNVLSSPTFGADNHLAWLSQVKDEKRELWLWNGQDKWKVDLSFEHSPKTVLFSKDGKAIYLLAEHETQQSLFHLWTPNQYAHDAIKPVRIPSNGTIYSAIHVGITPLDHAHLIGLKSDHDKNEGKELWVISHSPHQDPTYNYENIRLTYFT